MMLTLERVVMYKLQGKKRYKLMKRLSNTFKETGRVRAKMFCQLRVTCQQFIQRRANTLSGLHHVISLKSFVGDEERREVISEISCRQF